MQYKVPQNIDIEDKVIGPLTLKQFIYLMVGGGILFVIRFSLPKALGFLFMPIALLVGGFFLALAFFRPGDRPFEVYLFSIIAAITRPKKRIWKKEGLKASRQPSAVSHQEKPIEKEVTSEDLEKLAFIVDSGGFEDELKSKGLITAMQQAPKLKESTELTDTIAPSEAPSESLKNLLEMAREKIRGEKKEPTVQDTATVNPQKEFKYEKFGETESQREFEDIVELAKKRQEERFSQSRVMKNSN